MNDDVSGVSRSLDQVIGHVYEHAVGSDTEACLQLVSEPRHWHQARKQTLENTYNKLTMLKRIIFLYKNIS